MIYKKAFSFIIRDLVLATSYKFEFFLRLFFIFFSILTFYFVSKLIGGAGMVHLEPYGGDYFSFVLIGIAFSGYLMTALRSFSESIRGEQMMGTLEAMLVTPTSASAIIALSSLWNFIFTSFRVLMYLLIGILLGVDMSNANIIGAMAILILTIICFGSIGIISASFIMILKKGDPINMFFMGTSELFGGVLFPITVLPEWLQTVSHILPITYSLSGMRHALLQGYSLSALAPEIIALLVFSVVLVPSSLLAFRYAVNKAKGDGSLVQY
ncbi:MAG: ABC transporter permease [Candidatus Methanospirareceae archaeon]